MSGCVAGCCEEVGVVQGAREVSKLYMQKIKGLKTIDGASCAGWLGIGGSASLIIPKN